MANPNVPVASLAKVFNLTERRIQQLARDGVIPKPEKGKYDFLGSTRAYIKYLQDRSTGRENEPQDAYVERARLLKAQADKTEHEVRVLIGEVITKEEAFLMLTEVISVLRSKFMALPSRAAPELQHLTTYAEIESCLKGNVYEILTEVTRYEPERQRPDDLEAGIELGGSTTELEDQPVGGSVPPAE